MVQILVQILVFSAVALFPPPVLAQAYPVMPLRLVVPYPPGGPADTVARLLQPKLSAELGQSVIVENRPGGGASIGAAAVARSAPDGYTLLIGTVSSHAMNPAASSKLPYHPLKDFAAIAPIVAYPYVLVVHPRIPARSVAELISLAKAKPGALAYASAGMGTSNHFAGELFKAQAGVDMLHVPYKGNAPALSDVIAGQVQVMFELTVSASAQAKAGKIRALGIASAKRSSLEPDLPAMAETLPGFEATAWFGAFAPAGTPRPIVERLNLGLSRVVALQDVRERLIAQGGEPLSSSAQEFTSFVAAEFAKWSRVAEQAKISTD